MPTPESPLHLALLLIPVLVLVLWGVVVLVLSLLCRRVDRTRSIGAARACGRIRPPRTD